MNRPERDPWLMTIAHLVALRGTCPRLRVGSLLVRGGRILSIGYNGSAPGAPHCTDEGCYIVAGVCTGSIHSEVNCLAEAARMGRSTADSVLVTTDSPCLNCAKLLVAAGVTGIYYHRPYHDPRGLQLILEYGHPNVVTFAEQVDPIPFESLAGMLDDYGYPDARDTSDSDRAPVDLRTSS